MIIKYIYSCLIDADRLDAYNFGAENTLQAEVSILPRLPSYIENLDKRLGSFSQIVPKEASAKKIASLRTHISDECANSAQRETGIYDLTVPTGGGKTLASLRYALEHIKYHQGKKSEKKQIFFILPYTTIIEQNAEEIRNTLMGGTSDILEHHSNVSFQDDDSENENQYKLLTERWDVPIVITTQVQFLTTLFSARSGDLRKLHTLANSVIILDEAQTIPLNCTYITNAALDTLATCLNSTIVMCTATQSSMNELKVPLLQASPSALVEGADTLAEKFRRVEVHDARAEAGDTVEQFTSWLTRLTAESKSILVIFNTKSGVKKIYEALQQENLPHKLYYLTTYLCPSHRRILFKKIKAQLELGEKIIVVSTNLIECGVDLSFDTVVRNLAGIPAIIQSSGRANRHGLKALSYSYIVDVKEHLRSLSELKIAQNKTENLLQSFSVVPEKFNNNLISQKAVDYYFQAYFAEKNIESKMGYPIKIPFRNMPVNAYDLLSENSTEMRNKASSNSQYFSFPLKFVGDNFQVIEQNTTSILVQYDEDARKIQADLLSGDLDLRGKYYTLRHAQPYVVNVFDQDIKKLMSQGDLLQIDGVKGYYLLRDGAYSETFGVAEEGQMSSVML